jgi:hypothetical protein
MEPIDTETSYESPVSKGVWATVNERATWIIIAICLLTLLLINLYFVKITETHDKKT